MYNPTRNCASTLFTLGVLAGLAACGGGGGGTVTIGIAGPLSAANGLSMKRAAEMAAAEINAAGGIDGDSLILVFEDDEANPQKAIQVAVDLKRNREVVAVVGHVNSSTSLRAATIYNVSDAAGPPVLQISPASSSPALTQAGEWTFRITPTDLEFSPVLARYAQRLGRTRAAVLYHNDDYGQGVRETFERAFRGGGGSVVSADPYLPAVLETGNELDPYLRRAIGRGADALVIGGQAEAGLKIIQAARRLGYTGPILGSDGLTGIKDAGAVAEGVFVSSAFLPDRPTEKARTFVDNYRKRYNALPDHRGAMTYDVIYLLRDAILRAGAERGALRDYVAGIGRAGGAPAHEGVSGTIRFDENGDVRGKEVMVGVVRGGQLVTAR
jgi:branched-chain amino acid transport system substrate-binding protein